MSRLVGSCLVALFLVLLGGCNDDSIQSSGEYDTLIVTISTNHEVFSDGDTITVTVTAENQTESLIVYGLGSSNCTLHSVVSVDGQDYWMSSDRICTTDNVPHELGPGESRTESWNWYGNALIEGQHDPLPVGTYSIKGVAGKFIGQAVTIEVSN